MSSSVKNDARYRFFFNKMNERYGQYWRHIHEDCREALYNYLAFGYTPGGFLTAVLRNDLFRAAGSADFVNIEKMGYVARWIAQVVPMEAYGSQKAMDHWQNKTEQEREQILVGLGLWPTLFEIIRDPVMEIVPNF